MKAAAVFIGHGNPMNALADNAFTRALRALGHALGKPKAIACVSAHWYTRGLRVSHVEKPETIHDFGGFPDELFAVRYPAPGSPERAEVVAQATGAALDDEWGLDHGAWSVLKHMYPKADVPVFQLSVDARRDGAGQLEVGRALAPLREKGLMILGSGNVVHNLRAMDWSGKAPPHPDALGFDAFVKAKTEAKKYEDLAADTDLLPGGPYAVPTPDHWLPFLVTLGAAGNDPVSWPYEGIEHASMSMRCAVFGL